MEKKSKITFGLTVLICLLPILLGAVFYDQLPEQMPIHFNFHNVPDNFAPKNFALFGIPVIMAVVQAICLLTSQRLSSLKSTQKPRILKILEWFIPIMTVSIYVLMIQVPLGSTVYIGKSVCLILGILLVVIGNYTPKMSYEAGKSMIHPMPKSEKSFRKLTKTMGYSFIVVGVVFLFLVIWV